METNDLLIEKKIRENLGNGRRIYNIILGIFFLFIGGSYILEKGFLIQDSTMILKEFILLMSFVIIYIGIIGKEPYKTKYRLIIDNEYLKFKKTFESENRIKLSSITHLKFFAPRIVVTYTDFIKSYDFPWLTTDEFESVKVRMIDYCLKNKIETE